MAPKTVMTNLTSPVHVDPSIVMTTILNVKTKSAFTKVSSAMVKMIAVMVLTNLQVMVSNSNLYNHNHYIYSYAG